MSSNTENMTIAAAMEARHSVRQFHEKPIEAEALAALRAELAACNSEGGLHIQLVTEEPEAFDGVLAHTLRFRGVRNYFVLAGQKEEGLDERLGYYGERLVLRAQQLGLATCWVALTYRKGKTTAALAPGEVLRCVIALGYGAEPGKAHKNKPMERLFPGGTEGPEWFGAGCAAALLAPTARNQQSFEITLLPNGTVKAEEAGGALAKMDLGIVKYHFEQGAGAENFSWA